MEKLYAKVIVDIAHTNLDRVFEYSIPNNMDLLEGERVKVPFGAGESEGIVLEISDRCEWDAEKIKPVSAKIEGFPVVTDEQLKLAANIRAFYHTTLAFALRLMMPAEVRGSRISVKNVKYVRMLQNADLDKLRAECYSKNGKIKAKNRLKTIEALACGKEISAAVLDKPSVKYLVERGYAECVEKQELRTPYTFAENAEWEDIVLSNEQKNALEQINYAIDAPSKTILLHGVTGSGKTEIYIRAAQHCIETGKTALILVPEIALAMQNYGLFKVRFGDNIAILHSGLSAGERFDEWMRILKGDAKIVLGARSAVFVPLRNIGLIVIDEEHEPSYRADNHPQYSALEVAEMRKRINGAALVLGSATPQIETYFKVKKGAYSLVELKNRVRELGLPRIEIVDMREELVKGNRSIISGALFDEMKDSLEKGEQVLIFLNRRGYSNFVMCRSCGHTMMCTHCDLPLKYHSVSDKLVCHSCGRAWKNTKICPKCGMPHLKKFGVGTQQVEETVKKIFPEARVLRMDFDTTRGKDDHAKIYMQFKNREADILIGTQMIAKGMDFDGVSLSAIVAADTTLNMDDYRAEERTFQLIEQAAGRAGRKNPGRVIVQTYNPENYAIVHAQAHDYYGFFIDELTRRKIAWLPPYSAIFRILFLHENAETAKKACDLFEKKLDSVLQCYKDEILFRAACAPPVGKVQGKARYHILLKVKSGTKYAEVRGAIYSVWHSFKFKGVTVSIEKNPLNMQ